MNEIPKEAIILAARDLRPRWKDLLGDTSATQAQKLMTSLDPNDAEHARQTANRLLELFRQHEVMDVLRDHLPEEEAFTSKDFGERLFTPLPGEPTPITSPDITYRCPVPGCHYTWRPQAAGKRVPCCPHHPDRQLAEI